MTTKTDTKAVRELQEKYKPKVRGILSQDELALIEETLELKSRTNIELQNIRDVTVLLYDASIHNAEKTGDMMKLLDAMSGVCGAIDREKVSRGLDV